MLVLMTLVLYLALGGIFFYVTSANRARAQEGQNAHKAICVLVKDFKHRIHDSQHHLRNTEVFLAKNPNGIPGISAAVIKASINDDKNSIKSQKMTIKSLNSAKCDGELK